MRQSIFDFWYNGREPEMLVSVSLGVVVSEPDYIYIFKQTGIVWIVVFVALGFNGPLRQ